MASTDICTMNFDGAEWTKSTKLYSMDADLPQLSSSPVRAAETAVWGVCRSNVEEQLYDPIEKRDVIIPAGSLRVFYFDHKGLRSGPTPLWGLMRDKTATKSGKLLEDTSIALEESGRFMLFYGDYANQEFYSSAFNSMTDQFDAPKLQGSGYETVYPPVPVIYLNAVHLFCVRASDVRQIDHWRRRPDGDFDEDISIPLTGSSASGSLAVAIYQGLIHLLYLTGGDSPRLRLVRFDGSYWSEPLDVVPRGLGKVSTTRPALAVFGGLLWCFFSLEGTGAKTGWHEIGVRTFNGASFGWRRRLGYVPTYPDVAAECRYATEADPGTTARTALRGRLFVLSSGQITA